MSTPSFPSHNLLLSLGGIVVLVLAFHALFPSQGSPYRPQDEAKVDCEGTAIQVNAAYTGNVVEEWSCKPQSDDQKRHYLAYTNGVGTQCEALPGCNDTGEDTGVTCKIPGQKVSSSVGSVASVKGLMSK